MSYPGTIFIDIDGTIIEHTGDMETQIHGTQILHDCAYQTVWPKLLPGVKEFLAKYAEDCYTIIVTTGRKESARADTERMLKHYGIEYDLLIMGLGRGPRIVVNDKKPKGVEPMATGVSPERNRGLCEYL